MRFDTHLQCQQVKQLFPGQTHKLLLNFMVIPDVYGSFNSNKTIFTKDCFTHWILKLSGSFEIHWVRQDLVYITGPLGIVNATVYKTEPIFTDLGSQHISRSYPSSLLHWVWGNRMFAPGPIKSLWMNDKLMILMTVDITLMSLILFMFLFSRASRYCMP